MAAATAAAGPPAPPLSESATLWEKYAAVLADTGVKLIDACALLSTAHSQPTRLRNLVLGQKGVSLKLQQAVNLVDGYNQHTLQQQSIQFAGIHYLITHVGERMCCGRNLDSDVGGGLVMVHCGGILVVCSYKPSALAEEVIFMVERFAVQISAAAVP
mmetsp:Transcript_48360/g.121744  ORF Transcript_48360/g.121744 Transcript_48360/m.121744 type:complete len:158 (+) Transcript_48360:163-636(+)|eukprot:CAMPEP_0177643778 /NCGR_PEP_ID=MMETSP0447-20121125/8329_1 /TAXON_ID=0 /ORGANISM="Stygamoeba regulata, Strain BSH-02190019" /LENGTH=157 /DNA_ID=CAMNT_0019146081 /DNA_START=124 /DNA_END=597 /DNA_ORIENTATION=+